MSGKISPAPFPTAIFNGGCAARVAKLFGARSPSAIAGFVISFVIDALKFAFGRTLAHIGEEVLKAAPALANRNAASSVVRISGIVGVQASGAHSAPDVINPRPRHSMTRFAGADLTALNGGGPSASPRAIVSPASPQPRCCSPHFRAADATTDKHPGDFLHTAAYRRFPRFLQEQMVIL